MSDPASPRDISNGDTASNLSAHIQNLRGEVNRLRNQLANAQQERESLIDVMGSIPAFLKHEFNGHDVIVVF